ncbi:uncharacterized protein [Amphiura filiformis]|uniref:uncharacterized protein n=1 Tax=Amphiura filiformis TaxID=82378 RepID=UPI003B2117F4
MFLDIITSASMKQHNTFTTHRDGHTLDLILTRESVNFASDFSPTGYLPSDHAAVKCLLDIGRPDPVKMEIKMRKLRDIDLDAFRSDILNSSLHLSPASDLDQLVTQYDSVLCNLQDKHAPLITRKITCRPHAPWYNEELRKVKQQVRRCERRWHSTKLEIHRQIFKEESNRYHQLIKHAKRDYHVMQLEGCDSRQLFKKVDSLCTPKSTKVLPADTSNVPLVDRFSSYFVDKIKHISEEFKNLPSTTAISTDICESTTAIFSGFKPLSEEDIQSYLLENNLNGKMQSAYRSNHSTETALLRVFNDLLLAADKGQEAVLILLDYSAAFDTINHDILFQRLSDKYGITGSALNWFQSYFTNRSQSIVIDGKESSVHVLDEGVPQGSVIGPLGFTMYSSPLESIIDAHGISRMIYADDTQVYVILKDDKSSATISGLELCVRDIKNWSTANHLKLNQDKTEVLHITSRFRSSDSIPTVCIGDAQIEPSLNARNLGVLFENDLNMASHINNICRSASHALYKISRIRQYLDQHTTEKLVHAFVTCRLDNNNGLLYGLPDSQISKLQRIQNSAARLVTLTKSRDHISPILRELHWLPIKSRITYKILLLTYKSLHGLAPLYLQELLHEYKPTRNLRSTSQFLLVTPPVSTQSYALFKWKLGWKDFSHMCSNFQKAVQARAFRLFRSLALDPIMEPKYLKTVTWLIFVH